MNDNNDTEATRGDWTPEIWQWDPQLGRWSPEYGGPRDCVHLEISTSGQQAARAYDYWREMVFYGWDAEKPTAAQKRGFRAQVGGILSPQDDFYWYESDPVCGRRTAQHCRLYEGEPINLGLVTRGKRHHQQDGDRATSAGPGEFICYDPAYPSRTAWETHSGMHLSLDREMLRKTLGGRLPPPSEIVAILQHSRLAPFFQSQMQLLAQNGERLSQRERALVLGQTRDLALAALAGGAADESPRGRDANALFLAAQHLIQRHMAAPDFNANRLAQVLGCSRATLYRVFAERRLTVAGYLRELRLQRVQRLLQSAPPHHTIADIAAACGFMDSASFSRLFRLHYGISPRELRKHSR